MDSHGWASSPHSAAAAVAAIVVVVAAAIYAAASFGVVGLFELAVELRSEGSARPLTYVCQ